MNFAFYIAKRYLRSASKNNAINIINGISSLGIVLGAAALFIVLSGFSGLIDFSLSFTNTIDPDLKATSKIGKSYLVTKDQEKAIKNISGIAAYSKTIEERVLFVFKGKEEVTFLKGVDSAFAEVSTIKNSLFDGKWLKYNTAQVIIGAGISQKLALGLFDFNNPLEVYVPKPGEGIIENESDAFNKAILIPVDVYSINEDLDSKYVFSDLRLAQDLLGYKTNQISALEFKLNPQANEGEVIEQLQKIFGNVLVVKNRAQLNDALYKMLNTENVVVYLIFTLVIILVLFTFAGAIIMMILEKRANLKTLYNLGVEVKNLRQIFLLQGTLLCVFGGIAGVAIGSAVVLMQQHFQLVMITENLAYPMKFTFQNVLVVLTTIILLGFLVSLIASNRVSKKLLE